MDPEIPKLGSGAEAVDYPLRRKTYRISISEKRRNGISLRADRSDLIPSALIVLPEIPTLISETGCGQRPHFEQ